MAVKFLPTREIEARMSPYSPMSPSDFHSNDFSNLNDDGTAGYDFEFIPTLDNKYMCPICLLALRDPVQTECGHRFCHLCILRCIRNQARCPVDQTPLSAKQLFQDRSAQREVLDLKVVCSNKDCSFISELRNIKKHITENCVYREVPCMNKCGVVLPIKDLPYHEENLCPARLLKCLSCGQDYPANTNHEEDCKQHQPVDCTHCHHTVKRYRLQQHVSSECPQAPIHCVFDKIGCHRTHSRHEIQKHMETSTQIHLQYLLSTVAALQKQNDMLQENLHHAQDKLKEVDSIEKKKNNLHLDIPSTSSHNIALDIDRLSTITNSLDLYNGTSSTPEEEIDEIAAIKAYNKRMEENEEAGASSSSAASSPGMAPRQLSVSTDPCRAYESVKVLENKHKDHDQQIVSLDHYVRELRAKMDNQITMMKEINGKLSTFEQKIEEADLRCCNGLYYWRIKEYTKLRKAASQGDMTVLHSPGFYTSPQGYRMCIRANLDGVENAQGTHLSLFVHIMKGEYDDLLNWPFHGSITLTVINQREVSSQRSHISEMLEARSNLMAFRRPTTERNQKGYGYIDFFPLNMIETEGFIKANTLVIKAQVKVYDTVTK